MQNYILGNALCHISGQFDSDERAIESLGDTFLRSRPVTPPGEHFLELITRECPEVSTSFDRGCDISKYGRCVFLQREEELYGIKQFIVIKELTIHPTKPEHWEKSIFNQPQP